MSNTKAIAIVGVGGQGTVLTSDILIEGLVDLGYDVKKTEQHGLSQRGGTVNCMVKYGNAISPFNTLINCGNSSMERERTILPIFVRRSASGNKFPPESRSSVIVLNFMALNIRAFFPGRSWVKKTPAPLLVKWRKIIRRSNMGQITNRTIKTITKSNPRFNPLLYISL